MYADHLSKLLLGPSFLGRNLQVLTKHELRKLHQRLEERVTENSCGSSTTPAKQQTVATEQESQAS
jgi:hypothetical protein